MSWAALTSGGKDSILAIQKALDRGMEVTHLVTVRPEDPESYMFHTSNLDAVPVIARLSGMKYVEIWTEGRKERELLDLENGLCSLPVEGVITGAIASRYQYERILRLVERLSMRLFAPLWGSDPRAILEEVAERLHAIIVVVAAEGLDIRFLGRRIDMALVKELEEIAARRSINIAGEGGEYETLTLYAPFYSRPLTYRDTTIISSPGRGEMVLRGFC